MLLKLPVKTKYPDYRIEEVDKLVDNGVETYKVEIEKGREEFYLLFSADGKML